MKTMSESSKLPSRAMIEVPNVLRGSSGRSTLESIRKLEFMVARKTDQKGDLAANKDWGVNVVEEDGISPTIMKAMIKDVLSVEKVKLLATKQRGTDSSTEFL